MLEFVDEITCIEERSVPRPHYRVTATTSIQGHPNLAPGLLLDEVTMTVCLPLGVGTDLNAIKRAAAQRFVAIASNVIDHASVGKANGSVARESSWQNPKGDHEKHLNGAEQRPHDPS